MKHGVAVYLVCWLGGMLGLIPLALVLQTLLPRFLQRASDNLERAPWRSLLVGVLAVVGALLMLHVMGQAGQLGQALSGALGVVLLAVWLLGFAACLRSVGSRMFFSMNSPHADLAIPSTLLGGLALGFAAILAVPGGVLLLFIAAAGLGATLITLFTKKEATPVPPPPSVP